MGVDLSLHECRDPGFWKYWHRGRSMYSPFYGVWGSPIGVPDLNAPSLLMVSLLMLRYVSVAWAKPEFPKGTVVNSAYICRYDK